MKRIYIVDGISLAFGRTQCLPIYFRSLDRYFAFWKPDTRNTRKIHSGMDRQVRYRHEDLRMRSCGQLRAICALLGLQRESAQASRCQECSGLSAAHSLYGVLSARCLASTFVFICASCAKVPEGVGISTCMTDGAVDSINRGTSGPPAPAETKLEH